MGMFDVTLLARQPQKSWLEQTQTDCNPGQTTASETARETATFKMSCSLKAKSLSKLKSTTDVIRLRDLVFERR